MDQNLMIENVIHRLTGIRLSIFQQDITPRRTIENRQPQKKVVYGLNFPGNEDVRKRWEKYLKKNDLSFSLAQPLIFAWCQWFRTTGGK